MKGSDVEAEVAPPLVPGMENPELPWAFIRKIYSILTLQLPWAFIRKTYSILTLQLLLTVVVCAIVVAVHSIADFLVSTTPGLAIHNISLVRSFIISTPMYFSPQMHPFNLLLHFFTVSVSFLVGLSCASTSGIVILISASVTVVLAVSLTLHGFWAARRGHDSKFLGHFVFCSLMALIWFAILVIFFPFSKIISMISSILKTVMFSGYIVSDTSNLIKGHSSDDCSWASSASVLYLDIISLFLHLLELFGSDTQ